MAHQSHSLSTVDLQVNGYAGVDFNQDNLSEADLHSACALLREDGVAGVLATIITDDLPQMAARLRRIAEIHQSNSLVREVVWGVHIEGPFINENPGYVGAHPARSVRPADQDAMKALLEAAGGLVRMVTLAPERDPGMKLTRFLADQKILVSAGHCNPTRDELRYAIDAGLSLFTHLGNGCPMEMNRHDNIIQRALSFREELTICFIADGAHIPLWALDNYLRLAGVERSIVVTDAMAAARLGPGRYAIGSQVAIIGEDLVARSPDGPHLVGSTATMPRMTALLEEKLGYSEREVRRLVCDNPREALRRTGMELPGG